MDKFSELKAAAMAATPGPWILDDDSWSEGDNANVSTEERYDGRIVSIAQIEGGGSESGFDEPFSTEQQANARYITAANPAAVLALLAELEAKDKRITTVTEESEFWRERVDGAEKEREEFRRRFNLERSCLEDADKRIAELEAKLATPVRLPEPCVIELLANREAQPAGFRYRHKDTVSWLYNDWRWPDSVEAEQCQIEWLYTAPPAPAVPDGWIACSERMPTPFVDVIASDGKQTFTAHFIDESDWWCLVSQLAEEPGDVTHWMPLPAAPEGGNG